MRRLPPHIGLWLAGLLCWACSGASSPGRDAGSLSDRPGADGAVDATDAGRDLTSDRPVAVDGATAGDGVPGDAPAGGDAASDGAPACREGQTTLVRAGTTSSCSFPLPAGVDPERINLILVAAGERRLCQQGSNNCTPEGGWFWAGDEVALCDATCLALEETSPDGRLVLETGCPTDGCGAPSCLPAGESCRLGNVDFCCIGSECNGDRCVTCRRGGEGCSFTSDCCEGGQCQDGQCLSALGGQCASDAGCSNGTCQSGQCR